MKYLISFAYVLLPIILFLSHFPRKCRYAIFSANNPRLSIVHNISLVIVDMLYLQQTIPCSSKVHISLVIVHVLYLQKKTLFVNSSQHFPLNCRYAISAANNPLIVKVRNIPLVL